MAQLAAARQGTHATKTRGEVRGGGRKPYRQKGTGRARQGSTRAPQFAGGGVVHGPQPRDYAQRTPKKMKAAALRGALSDRARDGRIHVVSEPRRRRRAVDQDGASPCCAGLTERQHVLVVVERERRADLEEPAQRRAVHLLVADQLNTYDVLVTDDVVFTRGALDEFLAGPADGPLGQGRAPTESEDRPAVSSIHKDPRDVLLAPVVSREELRPARREQVHVPRPPGRQQDRDQDRGREGLRRQGRPASTRSTAQGKRKRTRHGLRPAARTPSARSSARRGRPHRHLRRSGRLAGPDYEKRD